MEEIKEKELKMSSNNTQEDDSIDANQKTLSPTVIILKRFFRSRLSIVGLSIVIALFAFSFLGPVVYTNWSETETDYSTKIYHTFQTKQVEIDGEMVDVAQHYISEGQINRLDAPSLSHPLGTDNTGLDILARIMYGGRISLILSMLVVFLQTFIGVILGGIAGYFGKWVDQLIMRIVDIFICVPTFPILLIVGSILQAEEVPGELRIYFLMGFITLFGWSGVARVVRGQILSLREQEFMVATEVMGLGTPRKIFKHLLPNVMPQLIVSMTLGLGGTILYEASLSYLGMGVQAPYAAWGTMISIISDMPSVISSYMWVWVPPGICIILAVLGFNFVGDGLRDALDPKMKR